MATLVERLRSMANSNVNETQYGDDRRTLTEAADRLVEAGRLLNEWSGSGERELPRMYRETHAFLMGDNTASAGKEGE